MRILPSVRPWWKSIPRPSIRVEGPPEGAAPSNRNFPRDRFESGGDRRRRDSQCNRFRQDSVAEIRRERSLGDDIDLSVKEILEILFDGHDVEQ